MNKRKRINQKKVMSQNQGKVEFFKSGIKKKDIKIVKSLNDSTDSRDLVP